MKYFAKFEDLAVAYVGPFPTQVELLQHFRWTVNVRGDGGLLTDIVTEVPELEDHFTPAEDRAQLHPDLFEKDRRTPYKRAMDEMEMLGRFDFLIGKPITAFPTREERRKIHKQAEKFSERARAAYEIGW